MSVRLFVSWHWRNPRILKKSMFFEKIVPVGYVLSLRDFVVALHLTRVSLVLRLGTVCFLPCPHVTTFP